MGNTSSRRGRRGQRQDQQPGHQGARGAAAPGAAPAGPPGDLYPAPPTLPRPAAYPGPASNQVYQTATVRNLVNLKKHTLKLVPCKDDASKLQISFMLDVVQKCTVSIFFIGQEERRTGQIQARKLICDRAPCGVGMSIQFPFEGMDPEQSQLPTGGFETEQLNAADVKQYEYPLFIRLETLADAPGPAVGAAASAPPPPPPPPPPRGQSLEARPAGAALVPWVQCQTTYALLMEPQEEQDERCRVVRQRIWVQGQFYDLQEIYGITEANQAVNGEGDFSADCIVCLTNRKNTTVLPCRHFCMCNECAKALLRRSRTCPMCRLPITSVLQIQIQNQGA